MVALAMTVLLVETGGRWLLSATVGLGVRPTGAVVAVVAVVSGPAAAPGAFFGALLAGLATSGTAPALASAAGVAVAVVLTGAAARDFGPDGSTGPRRWTLEYLFVVTCGVCVAAAASGLLSGLVDVGPFQLVVGRLLATNLPLALAVAPVAWYLSRAPGAAGFGLDGVDTTGSRGTTRPGPPSSARRRAAVFGVASVGWVLAGYAVGFVLRATERVPAGRIGDRLVPVAGRFLELVGPRGVLLQLLLGLVALSLLAASVGRVR